jgi:hypothetical protein
MAKDNSGLGSCVIVVGDPGSEFVRTARRLACECGIDTVPCDDVYSAIVAMAGMARRRLLVVGTMRALTRENGSFFSLAAARAVPCCGVLDKGDPAGQGGVGAALRAGASIVAGPRELRLVLEEWLAPAEHRSWAARDAHGPRPVDALVAPDDLRATEAELTALLG